MLAMKQFLIIKPFAEVAVQISIPIADFVEFVVIAVIVAMKNLAAVLRINVLFVERTVHVLTDILVEIHVVVESAVVIFVMKMFRLDIIIVLHVG